MDQPAKHVIRCSDDLVEAFRARKAQLGISNETIDEQLLIGSGNTSHYLGPSRRKKLAADLLGDLMTFFGVELTMRVNPELEAKMRDRYVPRDERSVRQQSRLSRRMLEVARSQLFSELGKRGAAHRAKCLTAKQRSNIARAAAASRWQRHRAAVKAASASEGAQA